MKQTKKLFGGTVSRRNIQLSIALVAMGDMNVMCEQCYHVLVPD